MTGTEKGVYKRRARVLFVGPDDDAWVAAAYAWALGSAWIEVRCARTAGAHPDQGPAAPGGGNRRGHCVPPRVEPLTAPLRSWADSAVLVGAADVGEARAIWPGVTVRSWNPEGDRRQRCEGLRERVEGMIGGLRMLARGAPPRDPRQD